MRNEQRLVRRVWPPARVRLAVTLAVILVGLAVAWYAIEGLHLVRVTVFQPFRMATVARGIALVFVAGGSRVSGDRGEWLARMRAILIACRSPATGCMVVVTWPKLAVSAAEAVRMRLAARPTDGASSMSSCFFGMLGLGLNFLAHHDTESGHIPLLAALGSRADGRGWLGRWRSCNRWRDDVGCGLRHGGGRSWRRVGRAGCVAAGGGGPARSCGARNPLVRGLISRCRFAAVPADDIERLALWCRDHTPASARFIGPPGPKTFRLWSQRSLAFNRAASPYHAAGLADWFARFQDHVDFHGPPAEFVRSYAGRSPRIRGAVRSAERRRAGRPGPAPGGDYVVAPAPERSPGHATRTPPVTAGARAAARRRALRGLPRQARGSSSSASGSAADGYKSPGRSPPGPALALPSHEPRLVELRRRHGDELEEPHRAPKRPSHATRFELAFDRCGRSRGIADDDRSPPVLDRRPAAVGDVDVEDRRESAISGSRIEAEDRRKVVLEARAGEKHAEAAAPGQRPARAGTNS